MQQQTSEQGSQSRDTSRQIGSGLKRGPNACVANILSALIADPSVIIYLPKGEYVSMGDDQMADPRVIDEPLTRSLEIKSMLCGGNGRRTICVRALKEVRVRLEEGVRPQLMQVWRTYALVREGECQQLALEVSSLSRATFESLVDAGAIPETTVYDPSVTYTISLEDFPLTSSAWAHPLTLGLVPLLRKEMDLVEEKKALMARQHNLQRSGVRRTKRVGASGVAAPVSSLPIYKERLEKVRKPRPERPSGQFQQVKSVTYALTNYLPSTFKATGMKRDEVDARLRTVNKELESVRCRARLIIIALEEHNSKVIPWGEAYNGRRHRKDQPVETIAKKQTATFDGSILIRTSRMVNCQKNEV